MSATYMSILRSAWVLGLHLLTLAGLSLLVIVMDLYPTVDLGGVSGAQWLAAINVAILLDVGTGALVAIFTPSDRPWRIRWRQDAWSLLPLIGLVLAGIMALARGVNMPLFLWSAPGWLLSHLAWRVGIQMPANRLPGLQSFLLTMGRSIFAIYVGLFAGIGLLTAQPPLSVFIYGLEASLVLSGLLAKGLPACWSRGARAAAIMLVLGGGSIAMTTKWPMKSASIQPMPGARWDANSHFSPPPVIRSFAGTPGRLAFNRVSKDGIRCDSPDTCRFDLDLPQSGDLHLDFACIAKDGGGCRVSQVEAEWLVDGQLTASKPPDWSSHFEAERWAPVTLANLSAGPHRLEVRWKEHDGRAVDAVLANWRIQIGGAGAERPNILIVLSDALRPDALGIYGDSTGASPFLDSLAGECRVYDRAYSTTSWTQPAVASLMTGLQPRSHGIHSRFFDRLPPDKETMAGFLSRQGWNTAGFMGNPIAGASIGADAGFAAFDETCSHGFSVANSRCIASRFLDWLPADRESPFFAYLHWMDTHHPYHVGETQYWDDRLGQLGFDRGRAEGILADYNGRMQVVIARPTPWAKDWATDEIQVLKTAYGAKVRESDRSWETLVNALKDRGLWDDTLLIIMSDHGEEFGEHGGFLHGLTLYEEVIRIPLVACGPGIEPGRDGRRVSLMDIFPSLVKTLGLPMPAGLQGDPDTFDVMDTEAGRSLLIELAPAQSYGMSALIDGDFKLIDGKGIEMFDLKRDPLETRNLIPTSPPAVPFLFEQLNRRQQEITPPGFYEEFSMDRPLDSDQKEKLKQLGYIR